MFLVEVLKRQTTVIDQHLSVQRKEVVLLEQRLLLQIIQIDLLKLLAEVLEIEEANEISFLVGLYSVSTS